jgi:phosphoribosylformylglycinamidine (FGAM) synthase-like amidotransferase family enzyme
MTKPKIAVILFPGVNCENETKLACDSVGMDAKILRWNTKENLSDFDGFVIFINFFYSALARFY